MSTPDPVTWLSPIADSDLAAAPTSDSDPNVVDASQWNAVHLAATIVGGSSPVVTVTVYYKNADGDFELTGDVLELDPSVRSLYIGNPHGLVLGFEASASGSPTSYEVHIGYT